MPPPAAVALPGRVMVSGVFCVTVTEMTGHEAQGDRT
jgi:hypothetical protein